MRYLESGDIEIRPISFFISSVASSSIPPSFLPPMGIKDRHRRVVTTLLLCQHFFTYVRTYT